jgi:hypothetical protein
MQHTLEIYRHEFHPFKLPRTTKTASMHHIRSLLQAHREVELSVKFDWYPDRFA